MHKHKGTKLMCIFMNVCAIFGCYVILKLVYTGIILLELNVSIVYVYKWLIDILDISIAKETKAVVLTGLSHHMTLSEGGNR